MTGYIGQWQDQTTFIIGGGPSAKATCDKWGEHIKASDSRIIVVNDAFLLFPRADVLYFGDVKWWGWNKDEVKKSFSGEIFTKTAQGGDLTTHLRSPAGGQDFDWSDNPLVVGGQDSGHQAINLAHHFGVSAIFLIGFDMQVVDGEPNWHRRHKRVDNEKPETYSISFVPGYKKVASECARNGIRIFNMNPDSALEVFPKLRMEDLFDEA